MSAEKSCALVRNSFTQLKPAIRSLGRWVALYVSIMKGGVTMNSSNYLTSDSDSRVRDRLLELSPIIEDAPYLVEGSDRSLYGGYGGKSKSGGTCNCASSNSSGGTCRARPLETRATE